MFFSEKIKNISFCQKIQNENINFQKNSRNYFHRKTEPTFLNIKNDEKTENKHEKCLFFQKLTVIFKIATIPVFEKDEKLQTTFLIQKYRQFSKNPKKCKKFYCWSQFVIKKS